MALVHLAQDILAFPAVEQALREPNGLLAVGGDLQPERLLNAYRQGIFPWYSPQDPLLWWSPDPRAVLDPCAFHQSRSMKRFHRHSPYQVTLNRAFDQVIVGCAEREEEGTWITGEIIAAYQLLHRLGHAHSVEVWQDSRLVGGVYGVAVGRLFCAESMFSRAVNGSKTGLLVFCQHFIKHGGKLIDCQILNSHTASLGVKEISRRDYLAQLRVLRQQALSPECWKEQELG